MLRAYTKVLHDSKRFLKLPEFYQLQKSAGTSSLTIVDVRTPEAFAQKQIPDSINLPLETLLGGKKLLTVPFDTNIVVISEYGGEPSQKAIEYLHQHGWMNASGLMGGMAVWRPSLNELVKQRELVQAQNLLQTHQFDDSELDLHTLNLALATGDLNLICDVIEVGAKANEDSLTCAGISAPVFIPSILHLLKAQGTDLKSLLTKKYGNLNTEFSEKLMTLVEGSIAQRIRQLETNLFWKAVWITRQNQGENPNFHDQQVKPYLMGFLAETSRDTLNTIFVPFCGKSVDMLWLQQQGYHVIGVDLSDEATDAFFKEAALPFDRKIEGDFIVKRANTTIGSLTLLCGDILKLQPQHLRNVHLVYDRAGYNSIPLELRRPYAELLTSILPSKTKMLLGVLEMQEPRAPQSGPPYFISEKELSKHFRHTLEVTVYAEKRDDYFFSPSSQTAKARQPLVWSAPLQGSRTSMPAAIPKSEIEALGKNKMK